MDKNKKKTSVHRAHRSSLRMWGGIGVSAVVARALRSYTASATLDGSGSLTFTSLSIAFLSRSDPLSKRRKIATEAMCRAAHTGT
eukprot:3180632-Amphidinium_carterae.1